jgi:hypothetical protein
MIQVTKTKKVFSRAGVQITTDALAMIDEHVNRLVNDYARRCKEGNVRRLTPELFWVALGRLNNGGQ